jgi:hypothetical protein
LGIKPRRIKWIMHVECKGKRANAYRVWWGIPEGRSRFDCKLNHHLPEVQPALKDKVLRMDLRWYNHFIDPDGNA